MSTRQTKNFLVDDWPEDELFEMVSWNLPGMRRNARRQLKHTPRLTRRATLKFS